jgi:hypothetical protein
MHFGKNYSDGMINVIFDEKQKTGIKGFWIWIFLFILKVANIPRSQV